MQPTSPNLGCPKPLPFFDLVSRTTIKTCGIMGKGAMVRGLIFVCVLSFWGLAALPPGAVAELRLGRVADMAFTPDGHGLLLLQENRVELWDFRTGKLIRSFLGHSGLVWCLAVSPDSDSFFTGALDRTVREWNLKTGEPLWTSSELPAEVFSLALTAKYLAAGLGEGTVFLWERMTKNLVRTWSTGKSGVYALAFDKDGKILAAGQARERLFSWTWFPARFFPPSKLTAARCGPSPLDRKDFSPQGVPIAPPASSGCPRPNPWRPSAIKALYGTSFSSNKPRPWPRCPPISPSASSPSPRATR
jgi:WD40 repeat protein